MSAHVCGPKCDCRAELIDAATRLSEAATLLASTVSAGSNDRIELHYALVRAAKAKLTGAMEEWREHLVEQLQGVSSEPAPLPDHRFFFRAHDRLLSTPANHPRGIV